MGLTTCKLFPPCVLLLGKAISFALLLILTLAHLDPLLSTLINSRICSCSDPVSFLKNWLLLCFLCLILCQTLVTLSRTLSSNESSFSGEDEETLRMVSPDSMFSLSLLSKILTLKHMGSSLHEFSSHTNILSL
ncbi:unnamed protein product [Moneuplotes crassus]|uniref:Uncharacterized protein n=1 Tax=Euplotes crassus TaxID=5936 RepID=A0AAD1YA43_EUPCR|nr:unnamed protein product [Moneuplotes crassus]